MSWKIRHLIMAGVVTVLLTGSSQAFIFKHKKAAPCCGSGGYGGNNACCVDADGCISVNTIEYVQESADDYRIIKRIKLPDADAARYYMHYLAAFGINSWIA